MHKNIYKIAHSCLDEVTMLQYHQLSCLPSQIMEKNHRERSCKSSCQHDKIEYIILGCSASEEDGGLDDEEDPDEADDDDEQVEPVEGALMCKDYLLSCSRPSPRRRS